MVKYVISNLGSFINITGNCIKININLSMIEEFGTLCRIIAINKLYTIFLCFYFCSKRSVTMLTTKMIDMKCTFKDDVDLNNIGNTDFERKISEFYPTSTHIREFGGLLLTSQNSDSNLLISGQDISLELKDLDAPCDKALENVLKQWEIVKDYIPSKGKMKIDITGLFEFTGKENLKITNILKWHSDSAKILGKGTVGLGAMINISNSKTNTIVSISGIENKKNIYVIQLTKHEDIDINKFQSYLNSFCSDVTSKLYKIINLNFLNS